MSNEEYTELLALIEQQIKDSEESRLEWGKRHDQLVQAMLNGFFRFNTKFDALTDRMDLLSSDMQDVKGQLVHLTNETYAMHTRSDATFDHVGGLTERVTSHENRLQICASKTAKWMPGSTSDCGRSKTL